MNDGSVIVLAAIVGMISSAIVQFMITWGKRGLTRAQASSESAEANATTSAEWRKLYIENCERFDEMEAKYDEMEAKYDEMEARYTKLAIRMSSVQEDARVDRQTVIELEKRLQEWAEGITILIEQIEGHDSQPNWRPKGE